MGRMKNATAALQQAWKRFRSVPAETKAEPFPARDRTWADGISRHKAGIVMGTCAAVGGGALMAWRKGTFRAAAGPRLVTNDSVGRPFGTN